MYENITCTYFIFARFDMKSVYHPTIILLKISKDSLIETIHKINSRYFDNDFIFAGFIPCDIYVIPPNLRSRNTKNV